ncbi:MAG: hypothetical protein AABY00_00700 [Nanoarchaeota archaeon]
MNNQSLRKNIASESWRLVKEKFTRYLPAELIGTASAFAAGAYAANHFNNNALAIGYAATLGETIGFYTTIITQQVREDRKQAQRNQQPYGFQGALSTSWDLIREFGLAEVIDTPLIRPSAKALGTKVLGPETGILAGKLVGDLMYFIIAGTCHELTKRKKEKKI